MKTTHEMTIAGCKRSLSLFPVNEDLYIAAFIMLGDVEITVESAKALLNKAPDFDILVTAEAKSIPLTYEMSRQSGKEYIVARKGPKVYMKDVLTVNVNSITTAHEQILCIGSDDVEKIRGRRVLIVDDVISTGESLKALEALVKKAGGNICAKMAVLAEGDAADRNDIIFLEKLPLFDKEGNVL